MIIHSLIMPIKWFLWVLRSNYNLRKAVRKGNGHIGWSVKIRNSGKIEVAKNVTINSEGIDNIKGSRIFVDENALLKIGTHSGMTAVAINCRKKIVIGDHVNIGAGCLLMDSDYHPSDWRDRVAYHTDRSKIKSAPIEIGDVVFIGARSIICKGVHIGDHSIVAAGSVVVSNIPDNCIAGGNPCRVIKLLDSKNE